MSEADRLNFPRTLEQMREQVQYGMPLTQDEVRWLVELATGRPIPRRHRCHRCGGEGRLGRSRVHCTPCNGSGYIYTVVICDGCNVPPPHEHRCHAHQAQVSGMPTGQACQCDDEHCLAVRGEPPSDAYIMQRAKIEEATRNSNIDVFYD